METKKAAAVTGVMYYLQQEAEEQEQESVEMASRRHRSGWSAYGRNTVARGRQMVQGRRFRKNIASLGRGYRPGISRVCPEDRVVEPSVVPHASGMQIKK